jgi:hypothetical protein
MGALLLNALEFLGNRIVEIRSNANTGNATLQEGVLVPVRGRSAQLGRFRQIRTDHRNQINRQIKVTDPRRDQHIREEQIKGDQRTRVEEPGPLRDTTSEGQSTL